MATSGSKPAPKAVPKPGPQAVPPPESMEEEGPVVKKTNKKRILIAIVVMLILGIIGGVTWYFLEANKDAPVDPANPAAHAEAKQEAAKPPVFVLMEPFTVNLQSEGTEQFLQVSFTVQVADQVQVELLKLYMPQVRSRLLLLLSSKKATEISTVEGKKKLSEEIIAQIKQPFASGAAPQNVSNVFFTSFVIQ